MRSPQVRAREPDETGFAEGEGVRLAYEVFGTGDTTVLLMPTWSIIDSRFWKAQVPFLSRHFRVVTFDGRGSGRSDRPRGAAAHSNTEYAADAVAVLDATDTRQAVLVALSCGATWATHVAAGHPDRVLGLFALAPSCGVGFGVSHPDRAEFAWDQRLDTTRGWATYNKHYWLEGGLDAFRRFFFDRMFSEPHSSKQVEDCLDWSSSISPETLVDTTAGRLGCDDAICEPLEPVCAEVRCPVTVVHGTDDQISQHTVGKRLAELTGGSLVLVEGGGHGPFARDPVLINRMIKAFVDRVRVDRVGVDRVRPQPSRRTWVRARHRPKRALYISSPIGLGHARRDLAIAEELRRLHPDLQIDWLAQHPVTTVLESRHERVHPASRWLASESAHIESEAHEHDLHAFQAIRRMDEILVNNFMVFDDIVTDEHYDLVIGDEAWDVDYFLHENPELKRFAYAWLTDFVGWLPMPDGGEEEARLTADYNTEMIEQRARFRRLRDRSIFVGNLDDVVTDSFGPGLPDIRSWTEQNFDFAGYATGFEPGELDDPALVRSRLGCREDEKLCLVTVGGSGVGASLLRSVLAAVPSVRRLVPELRFVVVAGPRIDPRSLPRRTGVNVRGYLPDLHRYLAACDLAVVQGGLTTCMELTATGRPFIYVPLEHHFEQNFHVRRRLERYGAGRHLAYADAADPDTLATAIVKELASEVSYRPVETDGAARAARLLAELV
ncbi:MAG: alpha/beta fold hydrolase [Nocardioidaceae bacterium]|nr:alpha/beta fold hydrolase [Nocardioidaceae bacterium]